MKVTEFFLGFGPKLWSFRRGETEYGVKAIPAGAYVRIIGMHNLEEVAARGRAPHLPPAELPEAARRRGAPARRCTSCKRSSPSSWCSPSSVRPAATSSRQTNDFRIKTDGRRLGRAAGRHPARRQHRLHRRRADRLVRPAARASSRRDTGRRSQIVISRNGEQITMTVTTRRRATATASSVSSRRRRRSSGSAPSPPRAARSPSSATSSKQTFGFFGAFFSPSGLSNFADTVVNGGESTPCSDNRPAASTSSASSGRRGRREPAGLDHRRRPVRQRDRQRGRVRLPRLLRQHQHLRSASST